MSQNSKLLETLEPLIQRPSPHPWKNPSSTNLSNLGLLITYYDALSFCKLLLVMYCRKTAVKLCLVKCFPRTEKSLGSSRTVLLLASLCRSQP